MGEYSLAKEKIMDIQAPKALFNITNSMRVARYRDAKIVNQACFVYKMLSGCDVEEPV